MIENGKAIESLLDAVIDGKCDEPSLRRFEALVRDDVRVREAYLEQMRMHALLEWRHGRVEGPMDRTRSDRSGWWGRRQLRWGLAAVLLVGIGLVVLSPKSIPPASGKVGIATVVEARNVVWDKAQSPIVVNSRLVPQEIRCLSGTLRIAFDCGALVTLEGPADLQILSGMRLRAVRGRVTARVMDKSRGFAIETPTSLVVDKGTRFGVEVDDSGRTGVVVFDGLVDLSHPGSAVRTAPVTRLVQGEALRVGRTGLQSRIIAVERRLGDDDWSTDPSSNRDSVIRSVCDNIRGLDSSKYYQIVRGGLDDDAQAYVDRPHQWNGLDAGGLPGFLRGADYIMPFNDDKLANNLEIIVEMARPATVYVFLDDRERKPPSWLTESFSDTGINIGLDEGSWPDPSRFSVEKGAGQSINHVFSVWSREVERGESIRLGALPGAKPNRAMYGIAAVARP